MKGREKNMSCKMRNSVKFFIQKKFPSVLMRIRFYKRFGRHLRLRKPKWLSEKVIWFKLYYYPNCSIAIKNGDKYGMRRYVTEKGFSNYLVPLYGVYNNVDEIDINEFPSKFVLKKTNSAGDNLIVTNKANFDFDKAKKLMQGWMHTDIGISSGARHYSRMKSRIICEKYMEDINEEIQIYCFHGEPKALQSVLFKFEDPMGMGALSKRRRIANPHLNFDEIDFNTMNPELKNLIKIAKILSENVPIVRVDFFESRGKFYIGELTYTPAGGFQKEFSIKKQIQWGGWLQIPDKKKKVTF